MNWNGDESSLTLGAFRDQALIGTTLICTVTLLHHGSPKQAYRAEVTAVYVAPEQRGQGVATALMQAARTPGLTQLGLSVAEPQTAVLRLYRRLGFEVWGVQPDLRLNNQPLTLLHLQKHLEEPS